ncbi:peptidylprolyl isomerase [Hoyosella rhizosphaerae]|uniref:peptidylprolyl isomerase n=1 Tax=Hoyosella rhizosphaerae TaxID=1755582 RepID=UPI00166369CB|nr:peptidylprolyl isomerase [Hoyosella rhizosphaerae]MBN4926426.1 peptidylprolyl isomerase [Hoyosella rhizosphaerae]
MGAATLLLTGCTTDENQATPDADHTAIPEVALSAPTRADAAEVPPIDVAGPRQTPLADTVSCDYDPNGHSARPVAKPPTQSVPATGSVDAQIELRGSQLDVILDRAKSPCAVNSFVSLANQGYFDSTVCHGITTRGIHTLQCGDPTGTGTGGPGYSFSAEFPTDQLNNNTLERSAPVSGTTIYPRGTIAMDNSGTGTNGSRFFIVYADSPLPPLYTVLGEVSDDSMHSVDLIADAGTNSAHSGAPRYTVQILSVRIER